MRADRLLSMLMLLETRGKMTARRLAAELEVSERTIYRDVLALSSSGIPIYTEDGPGGGISLVEKYKTDLTGLTADEVRALSMLNIPEPLVKLGVARDLKAALLKLSASFPSVRREDEIRTRQRIHLDAPWWFEPDEPIPHLGMIQKALFQQLKLHLAWREFRTDVENTLAPYGLVAKSNTWYLVAGGMDHIRVLRVSKIRQAQILAEDFEYPQDFSLPTFWKNWCEEFIKRQSVFPVTVRVSSCLIEHLPHLFGELTGSSLSRTGAADELGRVTLTLSFDSFEAARARVLGWGRAVEVLEPLSLRMSVIDYAQQIADLYLDK